MTVLYGIKNCDTVRKTRRWLDQHQVDYRFHDLRADGLQAEQLAHWCEQLGWERVINRRGRTFRQLPTEQTGQLDAASAQALMLEHPTLIRRPVLESAGQVLIGFDKDQYAALFAATA